MGDDQLMTRPRRSDPEDVAKAEEILERARRREPSEEVERRPGIRGPIRQATQAEGGKPDAD